MPKAKKKEPAKKNNTEDGKKESDRERRGAQAEESSKPHSEYSRDERYFAA